MHAAIANSMEEKARHPSLKAHHEGAFFPPCFYEWVGGPLSQSLDLCEG